MTEIVHSPSTGHYRVDCSKGGVKLSAGIDINGLSDDVYRDIILRGLTSYIQDNGASKIKGASKLDKDSAEFKSIERDYQEIIDANVKAITSGEGYKTLGAKGAKKAASKHPAAVKTEATNIAKEMIKDWERSQGRNPNDLAPREISALAKELLESDPSLYDLAKTNVEARTAQMVKMAAAIQAKHLVPDAKRVAARKSKSKTKGKVEGDQLSAKQAGLASRVPPPRQRPSATTH